jgi:hypothetical protein
MEWCTMIVLHLAPVDETGTMVELLLVRSIKAANHAVQLKNLKA